TNVAGLRADSIDFARAEYAIAVTVYKPDDAQQVWETIVDPMLRIQVKSILGRFTGDDVPSLFYDLTLDVADLRSADSRPVEPYRWRDQDLRGIDGLIAGENYLACADNTQEQCELLLLLLLEAHRLRDLDRFSHF